jgi:glucosyl-3-phosphoglycerate synthase
VTDDQWLNERTFAGADFDPEQLLAAKRAGGTSVSVCLPALNVADTIGPILTAVREHWMERLPLVDELVVVDSHSTDATVKIALEAGASVYLVDFSPAFIPGLLGPLLSDEGIGFVKAIYARQLGDTNDGGRVTEICARPLINLFYPELAGIAQPLAGEQAGRRSLLERLPFFTGYAVEIGLLIDILHTAGLGALAQVDLGTRAHVNQPTPALGEMAFTIQHAVLQRLARDGRVPDELAKTNSYARPERDRGGWVLTTTPIVPTERGPMCEVPEYHSRHDR